jgi:hypothetical protein
MRRIAQLRPALVLSLCLLAFGLPGARGADGAQTVHVLIVADTTEEAGLGADVVADKNRIQTFFEENVPRRQLNVQSLSKEELTPQAIRSRLERLPVVRGQDALVFYFTGHAAVDQRTQEPYFVLPGKEQLLRRAVQEDMVRRGPRTAVMITDCCAALGRFRAERPVLSTSRGPKGAEMSPLLKYLLFERCGLIDITSSQPGEVSLTRGDGRGSLFTYPLIKYLERNSAQRVTWEKVVEAVRDQVQKDFVKVTENKGVDAPLDGELVHQTTQTVHAYVITPALGMRVKRKEELTITEIVPLSPAAQAGLKVGDILLTVNGARITTEAEYSRAVDNSPPTIKLQVRAQGKSNDTSELTATLNH